MSSVSHKKEYSIQHGTVCICTILTHPSLRLHSLQELKQHLRRQNYPVELINDGINRAMDIPLAQLRRTRLKEGKQDEKIPFVTTHNPCNHNIFKSAKRFFPILEQSENMKKKPVKPIINHKQRETGAESEENSLQSKVLVQQYYFHQKVRRPPMWNM